MRATGQSAVAPDFLTMSARFGSSARIIAPYSSGDLDVGSTPSAMSCCAAFVLPRPRVAWTVASTSFGAQVDARSPIQLETS